MNKQLFLLLTAFLFCFTVFGQIGIQYVVSDNVDGITNSISADLDNDGDLDIVSISYSDITIAWFENLDGLGSFGPKNIIYQDDQYFIPRTALAVYDMDNDGFLDIITAVPSEVVVYGKIDVFQNTLLTSPPISTGWSYYTINNNVGASLLELADIDNDGIVDVISDGMSNNYSANRLIWLKKSPTNISYPTINIIDYTADYLEDISIEDIDNDGDLDIVAIYSQKISWYENVNSNGTSWVENFVSNTADTGNSVELVDIDNDGDKDILSASSYDNKIAWYENIDGLGSYSQENIISTNIIEARSIHAVDFDFDGDFDVFCTSLSQGSIVLFNNFDGLGNFSGGQIMTNNLYGPRSVNTSDINNDGILDIIGTSFGDDKLIWIDVLGVLSNEINGNIQYDIDNNGCDSSDIVSPQLLIESSNGISNFATTTDLSGNFSFYVNDGDFISQITSSLPNYYSVSPTNHTTNFNGTNTTDTANFCIQAISLVNDLNISLYPSINEPRPGFDTTYQIVYNNIGTTQLNGNVTFEFDNAKLNFLNASETIVSQTANTLTFNFTDLNPFETRTIDLEFNVFAPPTTNIDDVLVSTATVNPVTGDNTPDDNIYTLNQTVIGSYDPNDISVLEGEEILLADADKYLHYIIRFQNTGTASAINVNVENVLDNKFDWTTMQLESLSHTGRVEITNGSMAKFIFDNINLPDSTSDESNSHGFIAYKIKPKTNVVVGDIFNSTGDIYFDFNPAIVTNTVSTEIVNTLSVKDFEASSFSIFPNPANNILNIEGKTVLESVTILDINGRLLKTVASKSKKTTLDVSNLSQGLYFIEIKSGKNKQTQKFIKK